MTHELIVGAFPGDTEKAVDQLDRYHKAQDQLGIADAAAIIKPEEGKDKVKWLGGKKKATEIGAVAGAVLGLLGGPATMVILGAAGAATGNMIASLTHAGISKDMIDFVEQGIEPGSSAVIVIVEDSSRHLILNDLKDLGAKILSESVESHEIEGKYLISPSSGISET
jgi:uncharacterized membrane protein